MKHPLLVSLVVLTQLLVCLFVPKAYGVLVRLQVAIPSYLTALAVGELECRDLSQRTRVWSEPSVVEAAAYEFAETAKYLEAGGSRGWKQGGLLA